MAESVSLTKSIRIEWKVKNLLSVEKLESGGFRFSESQWRFELVKKERSWIGLYLNKMHSNKTRLCKFKIHAFIEDKDLKPQFPNPLREWPYLTYVWSCHITELRKKENLLTDGIVTFVCILLPDTTVEDDTEKEEVPVDVPISTGSVARMGRINPDLRHLLLDKVMADLTLKCGDLTIPAHKNILSACSEVFAAMFRNDMTESRSGVIEISDMDPSVLEQFVQFMYSNELSHLSMDTAPELYSAGDKYAVESLKRQCSAFMRGNIAEENACDILFLADAHSDRDLKQYVVSFILKTNLFQRDDIWPTFCEYHPKLAVDILNRVCKTRFFS